MTIAPADSTYAAIEQKVRRLTASSSQSALTSAIIQQAVNTFYNQDFPYAIKLDQMRSIYTIYTSPNVDRYPLDVNYNQGIRAPVYFEGIKGFFFKDRDQFYNMWPRWPTQSNPISGDGVTTSFSFTINATPFLPTMVVLGGVDKNGTVIRVQDDGGSIAGNGNYSTQGNMVLITTNAVGDETSSVPITAPMPPAIPNAANIIGIVNYVTGVCTVNFPVAPASGKQMNLWVSQYSSGRPYTMLFWNNEFQIRPVPDNVYKVEIETYLTPVQFLTQSQNPTLNQWWQYIAYGAAIEILRERQDMEGVQNLMEGFKRQEALVLERQGVEEIGSRNTTIFTATVQGQNFGSPSGWY